MLVFNPNYDNTSDLIVVSFSLSPYVCFRYKIVIVTLIFVLVYVQLIGNLILKDIFFFSLLIGTIRGSNNLADSNVLAV